MADRFRIDAHKLNYHISRVNDWLEKKEVYPIYIEISPVGACNHRCTFCAVDYIGYQDRFLETESLKKRQTEMGQLGVKSIMYAGEGEPLLHKDLPQIIRQAKDSGMDVAVTTNAIPLTERWAEEALEGISWIKASINAGTPETYAKIHGTQESDFHKAVVHLEMAVRLRNKKNIGCTIGSQMVLLPDNWDEVVLLAQKMKAVGCDYLVIKPYSQHKFSNTRLYENTDYHRSEELHAQLEELSDQNFSVVFRRNTIDKLRESEHYYSKCQATPYFWAYIMADGSFYGCSAYLLDDRFCYGNINENTIQEIWEGEKRRQNIHFVEQELDIKDCRKNCRMDEVNRYLWDLKHPPEHVNFI